MICEGIDEWEQMAIVRGFLAVGRQLYIIWSSGRIGGVHFTSSCQCSHIWVLLLSNYKHV